ncbi:auxin-responsive protein SAUR77-like [Punica granatum]|uniref:Uncharacterized protein n=2 Tax=Punica granatum TaxID=22663 RepID=A0A218W7F3_PUNGR|nr:auxin-responsive protein SAUR77-like [Punica granatum]OWM68419.1 hypothetical protein CDL15_Pgr004901 [Punica granatum]PKI69632.1 hypothetical protein CRG98_009987 [Punica granatum]
MVIVGKLTKLKSAMKRWPSFTKTTRSPSNQVTAAPPAAAVGDHGGHNLHAVYVGKSRRRYLVSSEVTAHPLFRELVVEEEGGGGGFVVACEVVLFEHLLWMLENNAAEEGQLLGSMDELVEFYTC